MECSVFLPPCECGKLGASWHGPIDGHRFFCCDACWKRIEKLLAGR